MSKNKAIRATRRYLDALRTADDIGRTVPKGTRKRSSPTPFKTSGGTSIYWAEIVSGGPNDYVADIYYSRENVDPDEEGVIFKAWDLTDSLDAGDKVPAIPATNSETSYTYECPQQLGALK